MGSGDKAGKEPVTAGEEFLLEPRTDNKRKAEEAASAGDECLPALCSTKQKVEAAVSPGHAAVPDALSGKAEVAEDKAAPAKKMTRLWKKMMRLPQKEVDWILTQVIEDHRVRPEVREVRRQKPDLCPSPEDTEEEEEEEEGMESSAAARDFIEIEEEFSVFQKWVRSKYDKHGYVEVDDKFLADSAKVGASSDEGIGDEAGDKEAFKDIDFFAGSNKGDEARDKAFKDIDFSAGSNKDMKEFFMNLWP